MILFFMVMMYWSNWDGMTDIAYEKGCAFLRLIEQEAGREKFDAFLNKYFSDYTFKTLSTDSSITFSDLR